MKHPHFLLDVFEFYHIFYLGKGSRFLGTGLGRRNFFFFFFFWGSVCLELFKLQKSQEDCEALMVEMGLNCR